MENPHGEPEEILLENMEKEFYRLKFLVETKAEHIQRELEVSIKAGELVGKLYDAFLEQYHGKLNEDDMHSLNVLCVRLVFCLYAEDAGIFSKDQFYHYLNEFKPEQMRAALKALFAVLDTPVEARDRFLEPALAAFPYVNGSLFTQKSNEDIPPLTDKLADLLLPKASLGFDWSEISPTIFGAVFESTLNPETRRSGGMHYTSIENIHKVIDPLFMDELRAEFETIKLEPQTNKRISKLDTFQNKLANLTFFDPACGSGNFLTETYLSLRRLENEVIMARFQGQKLLGFEQINPIRVNIHQFFGIEINDFAVTVATTALWIAESQMMHETERIIKFDLDYLPLKTYSNIREGNALRMDWSPGPAPSYDYIIGNPPFVGYSLQSKEQKDDILSIYIDEKGKPYKTAGKIDYVSGWYWKAAELMMNTKTKTAFVSTNSITQGEQVSSIWKPLFERFGIHIDFAYKTFRWDSESSLKAHVHCVIVGFSVADSHELRKLFINESEYKEIENINPYLVTANNSWVESRNKPLCDIPQMTTGNRPADGGHLIIEAEDYDEFIRKEPLAKSYIKKLIGSEEFINNKKRYCLWLVNCSPAEMRKMPLVLERITKCREDRLNSPDAGRQKLAETPHLFREVNNPEHYIIVPKVSSEKRKYVPIGFMDKDTISTDLNFIIPDATLYHFGILTSNVHMAWMRAVCGRLEMRYRYSKDVVYNNFPWPQPTLEQQAKIELAARDILDARALYPDSSLADLYDEVTMPPELRKAHQANDRAVMEAYGLDVKTTTESSCVAHLFELYQNLVDAEEAKEMDVTKTKRTRKKSQS